MNNYQKFYYYFFVFASISCFSPIKALPYVLPLLFIVLSQFYYNRIFKLLFLVVCFLAYFILYKWIYSGIFISQNFILAIISFSSFLPILFVNYRQLYSRELEDKLIRFILPLVTIQALWGIIQALYGFSQTRSFDVANGDFVEGTIHPGLSAELSFSNVMFVTNMIFITNFLLGHYLKGELRKKSVFYISIIVIVLASVVHSILIYFFAVTLSFLIIRPKIANLSSAALRKIFQVLIALVVLSSFILKDNFSRIPYAIAGAASPELPRAIVTYRVLTELPKMIPIQPYIGLGAGQFCSRASLINSGLYLGGPENPRTLPFFTIRKNPIADEFVFALMEQWAEVTYLGSSNQPYFSFLTIYSEHGLLGLIIFLFLVIRLSFKIIRLARGKSMLSIDCFILFAGVIYLVTLGIQENYYEVTQAIFIGILLLQFIFSKVKYAEN
jgi:hypothetical protein